MIHKIPISVLLKHCVRIHLIINGTLGKGFVKKKSQMSFLVVIMCFEASALHKPVLSPFLYNPAHMSQGGALITHSRQINGTTRRDQEATD